MKDSGTWLCVQEVSVSLETSACTQNLLEKHVSLLMVDSGVLPFWTHKNTGKIRTLCQDN
jgi:hypothetical protein